MPSLFPEPEPDDLPPQASRLAPGLRALAGEGVYFGTSSWKYEGWLGSIYREGRYKTRGKHSAKKFGETCLAEYAETFPAVCGDFAFYQFPSEQYWARLFGATPADFLFGFKVPEDITVATWPNHARYGARAGRGNEHFLDAKSFERFFARRLDPYKDRVATLIFEFGTFSRSVFPTPGAFLARLDPFLAALPGGFRYSVEVRNPEYLSPAYFDLLASRRVAHVFNAWTRMPELGDQVELPGAFTADFSVVRALLRKGRPYEEAVKSFEPYRCVREPNKGARDAMRRIAERSRGARQPAFLFVNNRLEGHAPTTIEAVADRLAQDPRGAGLTAAGSPGSRAASAPASNDMTSSVTMGSEVDAMSAPETRPLAGLRVAAFEARLAGPMAGLITKYGGVPVEAPALREVPIDDNPGVAAFADGLLAGGFDVVLFETGVGVRYLAGMLGARPDPGAWLDALGRTKVVARGPKPAAALRELRAHVDLQVPEPNTWHETLAALDAGLPVAGLRVAVQEYGRPNPELIEGLRRRGADVTRVPVYRWALPEDTGPLRRAIAEVAGGRIGAALFTSAQQVVHLVQVAAEEGREADLRAALGRHTVVGSIGPTTSEALRAHALPVDIEPEHPKMGHLVAAVAAGWRGTGKAGDLAAE